jgi:hypothetical protein
MLTVHLRVNDAATGQPTAVRLCVTGPDCTNFAPLGLSGEFPTGRNEDVGGHVRLGPDRWHYIPGACEIPLPTEIPLRVRVAKGLEYTPLEETVTLGPGQMALRFAIPRRTNSHADGWVSVDTRCHFLSPHAALLEAEAEDLDVVNLLATPIGLLALDGHSYSTTPQLLAFSGQVPALEANGRSVVVNTLNTHPVLGRVALLHSHRPVFPLTFGGDEPDDWSICDWCDQCHRKAGLTVWVDAFEPAAGLIGAEGLVAAILGKIDAIELTNQPRKAPLLPWVYRLWDAGFRIPLVGASGKDSNRTVLGSSRTLVRVNGESWVEGVRSGRTIATDGPVLSLSVEGSRVRGALRDGSLGGRVEIVAGGRVAAVGEGRAEVDVAESTWVAARCHGAEGGFAHTAPVALGSPEPGPEARAALSELVARTREWIELHGRFANPRRKLALLANCDSALMRLRETN